MKLRLTRVGVSVKLYKLKLYYVNKKHYIILYLKKKWKKVITVVPISYVPVLILKLFYWLFNLFRMAYTHGTINSNYPFLLLNSRINYFCTKSTTLRNTDNHFMDTPYPRNLIRMNKRTIKSSAAISNFYSFVENGLHQTHTMNTNQWVEFLMKEVYF